MTFVSRKMNFPWEWSDDYPAGIKEYRDTR